MKKTLLFFSSSESRDAPLAGKVEVNNLAGVVLHSGVKKGRKEKEKNERRERE